ncbi:palmitoyltransferase ZDHHC2 isoform X2 [Sceloporus undulatus]|uniref:palmitoyltransferase ZDHHC2 isoform X2 n=1 Tax=Sceloporus undulatus TaxID=8520 RepID=UPI001C4B220B|nr:palmitoyltransferase ZDHHC2 isoform X2 [Sceloporus undulatus]
MAAPALPGAPPGTSQGRGGGGGGGGGGRGSGSARRRCQWLLYWVPVLFICTILAWSYYAYVAQLCILTISNIGEKAIRYCDRCQLIKPDRCHHCSVCDKCILKMDHHCPWVNNCVGFSNYKFFLLFLAYSLLYCLFIVATDLQYFIRFWTNGLPDTQAKFHIMFLFFAAAMFSVSLSSLFGYHCWLVSKNKSTLEAFRAPVFRRGTDKNGFSLGFSKNLKQVFGDEKKFWMLPIFTSQGDGCYFPTCLVNQDPEQAVTPSRRSTLNKNENNPNFPSKPLRDSQSHLLTDTQSWTESSTSSEKNNLGMSNPALTMENET